MIRTLVKTANVAVDNQTYPVRYFELRTPRGHRRYSAEIMLAPGDRITLTVLGQPELSGEMTAR